MVFHIQPHAITEEREPIFTIGEIEYTVPIRVGAEIMLEAMEKVRTEPDPAVSAWCTEQLLGTDGWKALRSVKGLDPEIAKGIMEICRKKVFGAHEEEGKG